MHLSKISIILLGLASHTVLGLVALIRIRARDNQFDARAIDARDSSKVKYDRYDAHPVDARDSSKVKYDRYDAHPVDARDSS
ncbi:hypothetical protein N7495_010070 [Penicillium taxi]|uniref:uncharacterized protein n=1 Tax=Penicillium taxi TaxID=168475 RepID=UPI002544EAFC|nr:uncharacterized protein N7495_010070 [Penicillium taxi]KAJ5885560.1 hypothetical protein N7495_010070 [Penicillium taxi]